MNTQTSSTPQESGFGGGGRYDVRKACDLAFKAAGMAQAAADRAAMAVKAAQTATEGVNNDAAAADLGKAFDHLHDARRALGDAGWELSCLIQRLSA